MPFETVPLSALLVVAGDPDELACVRGIIWKVVDFSWVRGYEGENEGEPLKMLTYIVAVPVLTHV
jgi:hypothetical protein